MLETGASRSNVQHVQELPHHINTSQALQQIVVAAQQDIQHNCTTIVCAVCGCYCAESIVQRYMYNDIAHLLDILRTDEPDTELRFLTHYTIHNNDYRLQSINITNHNNICSIPICNTCMTELDNSNIPKRALKRFDAGPWPAHISNDLTLLESIVCASVRVHRYCVTLHPVAGGQGFQALRSHVVAIPKATPLGAQHTFRYQYKVYLTSCL